VGGRGEIKGKGGENEKTKTLDKGKVIRER